MSVLKRRGLILSWAYCMFDIFQNLHIEKPKDKVFQMPHEYDYDLHFHLPQLQPLLFLMNKILSSSVNGHAHIYKINIYKHIYTFMIVNLMTWIQMLPWLYWCDFHDYPHDFRDYSHAVHDCPYTGYDKSTISPSMHTTSSHMVRSDARWWLQSRPTRQCFTV